MRILTALALLLAVSSVRADTVVMKDGRQLQGRSSIEGDQVVVKSKYGEVKVPKDDVLRIDREDDVYSQYARKEKELGNGTADERYQLGVWARDNKLDDEAKAAFLSVLKVDPDHAGARAALGYVKEDGRWVTEEDQMRARGLVKYQGKWMTPAEKIKAETELQEKIAKARADAKKAEEDKRAANLAKLQAEREARLARIQAYEEELARARARQQAEDESVPDVFYGAVGPYGVYGLPYSYWVGPNPSQNDLLAYAGWKSGRYRYKYQARPSPSGYVTVVGGGYGSSWSYGYGGYGSSGYYGGWGYAPSVSSSSSWSLGVQLQGSWTSRSGRTQVRFRTGF